MSVCMLVIYDYAVWALSSRNDNKGRIVFMAAERFKVSRDVTK